MGLGTQSFWSLSDFFGVFLQISTTAGPTSRVSMGELVATRGLTNISVHAPRGTQDPTVKLVSGPGAVRSLCLIFLYTQLKYT